MKTLIPFIVATPGMVHGSRLLLARNLGGDERVRRKISIVFNVGYLALVAIAALLLSYT